MNEARRKTYPMTVEAGQRVYESGRQRGLEQALEVVRRRHGNDYSAVDTIAELFKLKEAA